MFRYARVYMCARRVVGKTLMIKRLEKKNNTIVFLRASNANDITRITKCLLLCIDRLGRAVNVALDGGLEHALLVLLCMAN